jgi:hypothetical protein
VGTIWLFPPGTDLDKNFSQTAWNMNAYANIKKDGTTFTIPLMTPDWKEWTGNGTFDVYVFDKLPPSHGGELKNLKISEAVTTVSWNSFNKW